MPLRTVSKRAKKSVKQAAMQANMHELKHSSTKRPLKQRIAIALQASGLSRKRRKKKR